MVGEGKLVVGLLICFSLTLVTFQIRAKSGLLNINDGKNQLVSFDYSNNSGAVDVKWMDFFLKNHLLKFWVVFLF